MSQASIQAHYNKVLTDIAVQFTPPDLSWDKVIPRKAVTKESDVWAVFDKDAFSVPVDHRADGAESAETTIGWRYEPYLCEEHALHDVITQRMRDNVDDELGLEAAITENVKQQVWNNIELRVFGPSGIGLLRTAANNSYSANVSWATLSTASPRTDIQVAIDNIEKNCGRAPNTIVLTRNVGRHITRTSEFRDEAKYTVDIRNEELPTQLYGLNAVYVSSLLNTTSGVPNNRGQAKTLERIMGDDVWIGYVNPSMGYRDITYGLTLTTEEYASSWYEDKRRADIIEYGMIYDIKLIAKECGGLLTTVLT